MRKKKTFELSYIGVKNHKIEAENTKVAVIYHKLGDYSAVFKISNSVPQHDGNTQSYTAFHQQFSTIIKLLGEGYTIQKQDVFSHATYKPKEQEDYFLQQFEQHFDNRHYNAIVSYLVITKNNTTNRFFQHDERDFQGFLRRINKISDLLSEFKFSPILLDEEQIDDYVKRYLVQNFTDDTFSIKNFKVKDNHIDFSDEQLKVVSLVDVDEINFPTTIKPYATTQKGRIFPEDIVSFLHRTPACRNVLYNQVIRIPDQRKENTKLMTKMRRHSSMPDPANLVCVEDIENLLGLIQRTNDLLVYCHFDVLLTGQLIDINRAENFLESNLSRIGIIPSNNAYNQLELFKSSFPAHTQDLQDYDLFLTTSLPALCLLYKESPKLSENGSFKLHLTDRQGVPVNIDTNDQPMETGRITNRNKFVLGPSGSGKSFLMNTYVHQTHAQGADIIIIDTGHSYQGLCSYANGRYISYSEENPITMNPFDITKLEYNEEKKDFLKALISLIWKGNDGTITPVEDSALTEAINNYYKVHFYETPHKELSFNSFYDFSCKDLARIREEDHVRLDVDSYTYVLKKFYKGGQYQDILNKASDNSLFEETFIVFEIDNIKDNKTLFPITTLIIMDVFLQKMRLKKGRKSLIIEEAWKAIASPMMAEYILYVYKTVRKWNGEAILVTQELEDIIGNEIVKNSVINNSDTIILLDQAKFRQNYDEISDILSLTEVEQNKVFTINQLDNKDNRSIFKETYIKRGDYGEVFGVEVSRAQYFLFTTERSEKDAIQSYLAQTDSYKEALITFIDDLDKSGMSTSDFCRTINKRISTKQAS